MSRATLKDSHENQSNFEPAVIWCQKAIAMNRGPPPHGASKDSERLTERATPAADWRRRARLIIRDEISDLATGESESLHRSESQAPA
jgi:hypothetical protein